MQSSNPNTGQEENKSQPSTLDETVKPALPEKAANAPIGSALSIDPSQPVYVVYDDGCIESTTAQDSRDAAANNRLDDIIALAKTQFIPGFEIRNKINHDLRKQLYKDSAPLATDYMKLYYNGTKYSRSPEEGFKRVRDKFICDYHFRDFTSYLDSNFTIDANHIKDTHFIASIGPKNSEDVEKLFENTVSNLTMPIYKIIALGSTLSPEENDRHTHDFYEYFLQTDSNPVNELLKKYSYSCRRKKGNCDPEVIETDDGKIYKQFLPKEIIQSELCIQPKSQDGDAKDVEKKQLNITLIPIEDNGTFDLVHDTNNTLKETLWEIYHDANVKKENILIHCGSGIGRTGHLIFTLELLRHYKSIFEEENVEVAASNIMNIVNRMRADRFSLIQVKEQFTDAIKNAQILYKYGLEKGYVIDAETPVVSVPKTPQTLFAADPLTEQPSSPSKLTEQPPQDDKTTTLGF